MTTENPAQRLYDLITKFRDTSRGKPNVTALDIWKGVWGIGENEVFQKILDLSALISDIENNLKFDSQVVNKKRYLSWVEPIRNTLLPSQLMSEYSRMQASYYEPHTVFMVTLEFCCEALSKSCAENKIANEVISDIRHQLDSLISEINDQVTDAKTRALLLDLLVSVEFGLRTFQVRGPIGIEESLDLALGKLLRHNAEFDPSQKSVDGGIIKKLLAFLKTTGEVVDSSKKIADGLRLAGCTYEQIISSFPSP